MDDPSAMISEAQRWRLAAARREASPWKEFYLILAQAYEDAARSAARGNGPG